MAHAEKRDGKLTGYWYGEVDKRNQGGARFRKRFERKVDAEGYEAYVKATGQEPPWQEGEVSGRTFKVVADELKEAGGPNGVWARGRDRSVMQRLEYVCDGPIGRLPIEQVTYGKCEVLVADLRKRPGKVGKLDARTINRYLTAISSVMTYAEQKGYVPRAPLLPWQKEVQKKKQLYSDVQRFAVLRYMRAQGWNAEAFCVDVLDRSGVRIGELLNLRPEQIEDEFINLDDPEQIKNQQARLAFIGEDMARELRALVASNGLPKYNTLHHRIAAAVKACGYNVKRVVHAFRASTATRTVSSELDIQVAKELLGHKSIQTTLGYREISRDVLRERAKKMYPQRGEEAQKPEASEVVEFKKHA